MQFGQDALEQHRQLGGRLVAVVLGQLHHAVLHDVERRFLVSHVIDRPLESAAFDAFRKSGVLVRWPSVRGAPGAAWEWMSGAECLVVGRELALAAPDESCCGAIRGSAERRVGVIIAVASQKANGSRSGGTISPLVALASKSWRGPARVGKGHPRFSFPKKLQGVDHGNLEGGTSLPQQPRPPAPATPRKNSWAPKCWSRHCRPKASSTSGATPAARFSYIYDAFYKQDTIQHVLVRHEQAAVHAADGLCARYRRGEAWLVTSGPGPDERPSRASPRPTWTRSRW